MVWRKVDPTTGKFIEDVVNDAAVMLDENGGFDPAYIATPVPPDAGFYHPRWDFATEQWTEGLTAEEIAARQAAPPPAPTPDDEWKLGIEAALIELAAMIAGGV